MNLRYLLRRLATLILVLIGVSILSFAVVPLVPGSPARVRLGVQATPAAVATLEAQLGLDKPLHRQYLTWIGGVLRGDFGESLISSQNISAEVTRRLPATLQLAFAALAVGLLIAVPAGISAALRPGSGRDVGVGIFSQLGVSVPDFWLGILMITFFAETLDWLPSSGYVPLSQGLWPFLTHLALPAVAAGVTSGAIMTRFVRSAMLEVMSQDYVRTARAKGLHERVVVNRHALRNASISIATIIGLQMATLLSAVVVIEIIFSWPGLGSMALNATLQRDYPVLQAALLLFAATFAIINLLTDLSYLLLDPSLEYT
ncbi:MAG: ABC transporter permease [Trueperaceae bacterium]|jgi:peptide/nickel transport system permease protein